MINGIINIYKDSGFTSHDVVAKLRGILKQKKIGHTGTLDPDATGVLPVCLGAGTKLCDMLTDKSKEYRGVLRLGIATDTEDMTGNILETKAIEVAEEEIRSTISSFVGEYMQIPPMYSALKINGQKLCDMARKGMIIERKPRLVYINSIEIENINLPEITLLINCSKGTYIRSLCRDIGEKLGCGGCMQSLVRTRVGIFEITNALKLSEVEQLVREDKINEYIIPVEDMFKIYPKVIVRDRNEMLVKNGNSFFNENIGEKIRVYFSDGVFAGIYYWNIEQELYKPEKMFLNGNT